METVPSTLIVLANLAVIVVLVGLAHVVGWAGPSFAAGFIAGASVFFTWYRIKHGRWP